jgi:hypothetical protein
VYSSTWFFWSWVIRMIGVPEPDTPALMPMMLPNPLQAVDATPVAASSSTTRPLPVSAT